MPINFQRISNVVRIQQDTNQPLLFSNVRARITVEDDNQTVQLMVDGQPFTFLYTNMTVNGQIPSTITTAITLLNSIFGS